MPKAFVAKLEELLAAESNKLKEQQGQTEDAEAKRLMQVASMSPNIKRS